MLSAARATASAARATAAVRWPRVAARRVWSEASALEVEHTRLRSLLPGAVVLEHAVRPGATRLSLVHADASGVELATLLLDTESSVMSDAAAHEAVPLSAAGQPLVRHALALLQAPVVARAPLPRLCAWVASVGQDSLAVEFGADAAEAATAIALGRPRPGHSVLGQGTFRAALPAWAVLAERFAASTAAEEAGLFRSCGMGEVRVELLGDTSAEGLAQSGGAVAWLSSPGVFER